MRAPVLAVVASGLAAAASQPAAAQSIMPTTILHLSATGSVEVAPDQLVAALVANGKSASPAVAQQHVNDLMAAAMKTAQGAAGIEARATGYNVSPADEKHTAWLAQQTLELRGQDGPALLELAGKLQESGLAMASLEWRLSMALRRRSADEAGTKALQELQARAASAAATLGLHVDHLQEVRLGSQEYQSRQPMMGMAMSRMSSTPPQATATPQDVTETVSADVLLRQ